MRMWSRFYWRKSLRKNIQNRSRYVLSGQSQKCREYLPLCKRWDFKTWNPDCFGCLCRDCNVWNLCFWCFWKSYQCWREKDAVEFFATCQITKEKAKEVLELNNIKNVELFAQDTLKYLKSIKKKFDVIILDPPRKGCTQDVLDETLLHAKSKIIYVSCNPATLARDLKYLTEHGAKVERIQPFDMFCHTYHIENVAIISL